MIIKKDFILRQVAGTHVVLPVGVATVNFNGMITLNESGVLLWQRLEEGATLEELAELLTVEYNVSLEEALKDANEFVTTLDRANCIEH